MKKIQSGYVDKMDLVCDPCGYSRRFEFVYAPIDRLVRIGLCDCERCIQVRETDVNYKQLVEMHKKHSEAKGLRILAFPCNQFGNQEPRTSDDIKAFVAKYNVQFDLFEKTYVNGPNAHPLLSI